MTGRTNDATRGSAVTMTMTPLWTPVRTRGSDRVVTDDDPLAPGRGPPPTTWG